MASANQEVQELKEQISNMEKVLKAHVKATGNGSGTGKIEHLAHQAGENLREFFNEKSNQVATLRDETSSRIAKRPLTSAAAAFGAGMLIAALLRR